MSQNVSLEDLFEEFSTCMDEGLNEEELSEFLSSDDGGKEIRKEIRKKVENMIKEPVKEREKIYDFDGYVEDIFSLSLESMGISEAQLSNFFEDFEESERENVADQIMTWRFCLCLMSLLNSNHPKEYEELVGELIKGAKETSPENFTILLNNEFDYRKLISGFKNGFYSATCNNSIPQVRIRSKLEGIKEVYEGMIRPLYDFISSLKAIQKGESIPNKGRKHQIITQELSINEIPYQEICDLRNSYAHNSYEINENSVRIWTENGENKKFEEEEIEKILVEGSKNSRRVLTALADKFVEISDNRLLEMVKTLSDNENVL